MANMGSPQNKDPIVIQDLYFGYNRPYSKDDLHDVTTLVWQRSLSRPRYIPTSG